MLTVNLVLKDFIFVRVALLRLSKMTTLCNYTIRNTLRIISLCCTEHASISRSLYNTAKSLQSNDQSFSNGYFKVPIAIIFLNIFKLIFILLINNKIVFLIIFPFYNSSIGMVIFNFYVSFLCIKSVIIDVVVFFIIIVSF